MHEEGIKRKGRRYREGVRDSKSEEIRGRMRKEPRGLERGVRVRKALLVRRGRTE